MHPLSCADRASHPAVCSPWVPWGTDCEILVFLPKENLCSVADRRVEEWPEESFLPGGWEP